MRTAKPAAPEGAAGTSRRQPVRQTRVNPPRTSSLNRANVLAGAPASEQPINILPGVTHFTDAITALPKELVRHFTLLKEVDAKIFAPEAALLDLLHDTLDTPAADFSRLLNNDTSSTTTSVAALPNATATANPPVAPPSEGSATSVFDPSNLPRRTTFRDTALKIQEMLVSLEEKNHVIATANDALQKQLSRIDDIWPHLQAEFSDEAKWGSTTHWAYVENRQAKANDKQAERSRREGAATLSAAAQALAEEAAARSNDRKQAIAAKKNAKNQAAAEAEAEKAHETGKKTQGKSRKPLPDAGPVGLGIAPAASGSSAPTKRRKVEAKANGAAAERAMGTVFGVNAAKRGTTSPRETPAPEGGSKKRKALPTSSGQAKKRTTAGMSPSVTSSPVIGTFPDPVRKGSPAPSVAAPRPASSRARQNSTHSNMDNPRQRRSSVASSKPNGNVPGTPDLGQASNGVKTAADGKGQKETAPTTAGRAGLLKMEIDEPQPVSESTQNGGKEATAANSNDETGGPKETVPLSVQPTAPPMAKSKSSRASKPSTPATPTFAEAGPAGPNSVAANNANTTTGATTKRSHKKGASISAASAAVLSQTANSNTALHGSSATGPGVTAGKDRARSHDNKDAASSSGAVVAAASGGSGNTTGRKDKTGAGTGASHTAGAAARASGTHAQATRTSPTSDRPNGLASRRVSKAKGSSNKTPDGIHDHDVESTGDLQGDNAENRNGSGANGNAGNKNGSGGGVEEEDEDEDVQDVADEDVYCFCNQGSYGEMVACDGAGCPREWFHLECVGLKVAPKGNAKWYCEDCKKRLKIPERR